MTTQFYKKNIFSSLNEAHFVQGHYSKLRLSNKDGSFLPVIEGTCCLCSPLNIVLSFSVLLQNVCGLPNTVPPHIFRCPQNTVPSMIWHREEKTTDICSGQKHQRSEQAP